MSSCWLTFLNSNQVSSGNKKLHGYEGPLGRAILGEGIDTLHKLSDQKDIIKVV